MKAKTYTTIFFVIGLATLAYMTYKIGPDIIWSNLQKTGYWFLPIIGSWFLIYLLNAFAFKEIIYEESLPHTKLSLAAVFKITVSGYAINYITPFIALGGEPYRIMELRQRLSTNKATSSVLLYNIMHIFSHFVFWMMSIVCIVAFMHPDSKGLLVCGITFIVFFFIAFWVYKKYSKGLLLVTFGAFAKLPLVGKKAAAFLQNKSESLREIDTHIIELFSLRRGTFYASLSLEFVARLVGCLEIYFIAVAIGAPISFLGSFIISSGSSLFANLIFFSPMQLGAREGGFILALQSMGIPAAAETGVFISLATRIREIVWIFIGLILVRVKTKI